MKTLAACSMLVSSLYEPLALRGTLAATFFTSALSVTVHEKANAATFFTLDCARKGRCRQSLHLLFWRPCSQCCLPCKATPWQSLQQFITRLCSQMPDPMPTLQRLLLSLCSQKPPPLHSLQRALTRPCSQHFRVQLPFRKQRARGSAAAEVAVGQHCARKATPVAHLFASKVHW